MFHQRMHAAALIDALCFLAPLSAHTPWRKKCRGGPLKTVPNKRRMTLDNPKRPHNVGGEPSHPKFWRCASTESCPSLSQRPSQDEPLVYAASPVRGALRPTARDKTQDNGRYDNLQLQEDKREIHICIYIYTERERGSQRFGP